MCVIVIQHHHQCPLRRTEPIVTTPSLSLPRRLPEYLDGRGKRGVSSPFFISKSVGMLLVRTESMVGMIDTIRGQTVRTCVILRVDLGGEECKASE